MTVRPGHDDPSVAAMAGWAQLLHDVVERRLRPDAAGDLLAPSWDGMFDAALAEVMQAMLADRVARLSPEEFVSTYRAVHGDASLLVELERVVADRVAVAAREQRLAALRRDATVAGRLQLRALDADETLDLGLFDPTRPDLAGWRFRDDTARRPLHRVLRVRLTDPAAGEVRVVSDTWVGAVWAERWRSSALAPLTAARLGTPWPERPDPAPEVTLHAPVVLVVDGDLVAPPGVVGYVRTLDGRFLLDGGG